ncbi:MAG: serine--tRNA ligase [Gammaproteobacteria bacterium]
MLDPSLLRNELEQVISRLGVKHFLFDREAFHQLEQQRKELQTTTQELQHQRNARSKAIGQAKAQGQDVSALMTEMTELAEQLKQQEQALSAVQAGLQALLYTVPNIPHESVPVGNDENDNLEIRRWGEPKQFNFAVKDHATLGAQLNLMDFEASAKLSGSRFVVLRGALAKLQRALTQFMLDVHIQEHGYQELYVPYIVNSECLYGTGQLPKFADDQFQVSGETTRYLIPTAEVSITNTVRDSIIDARELPLRYVSHTPCFRSEAGSYGKDTHGMFRQHQFEKVELVWVVHPDKSYEALEQLVGHAETILQRLNLPYRVVALCGGDLGFSAAKTYDIEVWLPEQQRYREISSCSNCTDFQARRMQARFRDLTSKKPALVHTLNGSGLAVGRTLIAVIENYQDEQGNIHIPPVLQPYMQGMSVIK